MRVPRSPRGPDICARRWTKRANRLPSNARHLVWVCLALIAGCAQLPEHPDLPVRSAVSPGGDAALDRMFSAAEIEHSGASGFRLVVEGMEAFVTRMQSARLAERSIDVQTYIW